MSDPKVVTGRQGEETQNEAHGKPQWGSRRRSLGAQTKVFPATAGQFRVLLGTGLGVFLDPDRNATVDPETPEDRTGLSPGGLNKLTARSSFFLNPQISASQGVFTGPFQVF